MAKQYRKVLDETFGTKVEIIEDIEADPGAVEPASTGESSKLRPRRGEGSTNGKLLST